MTAESPDPLFEIPQQPGVRLENRVGEIALAALELGDFFLDGPGREQAIREDVPRLPDPVRPIDRLRLYRGVPPRIQQEHVLRGRQVQSEAAGLQTDQEDAASGIALEAVHGRRPTPGRAG